MYFPRLPHELDCPGKEGGTREQIEAEGPAADAYVQIIDALL